MELRNYGPVLLVWGSGAITEEAQQRVGCKFKRNAQLWVLDYRREKGHCKSLDTQGWHGERRAVDHCNDILLDSGTEYKNLQETL